MKESIFSGKNKEGEYQFGCVETTSTTPTCFFCIPIAENVSLGITVNFLCKTADGSKTKKSKWSTVGSRVGSDPITEIASWESSDKGGNFEDPQPYIAFEYNQETNKVDIQAVGIEGIDLNWKITVGLAQF